MLSVLQMRLNSRTSGACDKGRPGRRASLPLTGARCNCRMNLSRRVRTAASTAFIAYGCARHMSVN